VIVDRAAAVLAEHEVPTPRVDAEWIVAHALGVGRSELAARSSEVEEALVWPLVERRAAREPLAYVLGEWGFRRLALGCDGRALVPRPETEAVVERCLALLAGIEGPRVLDVGTGTGAIALALADEANAVATALDSSADALALAGENARRTGLPIRLVHGDLRDGLPPGPFDLVVSNPPYVPAGEIGGLEPEVRDWEPREALIDTGQTEALVGAAPEVLAPGGRLVLEAHENRAAAVRELLVSRGYEGVTITRDLAGRERVVDGRWP
jgi:release factor glutamine methyltransferase